MDQQENAGSLNITAFFTDQLKTNYISLTLTEVANIGISIAGAKLLTEASFMRETGV